MIDLPGSGSSFLSQFLRTVSGGEAVNVSQQLLFDSVIGVRGVVPGVGVSTIVYNMAMYLATTTSLNVCLLDTNYIRPSLSGMCVEADKESKGDLLDYSGDLPDVLSATRISKVHIVSIRNRTFIDLLSTKDSTDLITKLVHDLKSSFDIILIDLSEELSCIAVHAAIKCNRVIWIAEDSFRCIVSMKKALNSSASLGVSPSKSNRCILNKALSMDTGMRGVLSELKVDLIGEIPLSDDIAKLSMMSKPLWGASTLSKGVRAFNLLIDTTCKDLIKSTSLNKRLVERSTVSDAPIEFTSGLQGQNSGTKADDTDTSADVLMEIEGGSDND